MTADGKASDGPAAARELFRRVGWLRPVGLAVAVPGLGGWLVRAFSGQEPAVAPAKPHAPAAS